jgi:hypothetical protein
MVLHQQAAGRHDVLRLVAIKAVDFTYGSTASASTAAAASEKRLNSAGGTRLTRTSVHWAESMVATSSS